MVKYTTISNYNTQIWQPKIVKNYDHQIWNDKTSHQSNMQLSVIMTVNLTT